MTDDNTSVVFLWALTVFDELSWHHHSISFDSHDTAVGVHGTNYHVRALIVFRNSAM